MCGASDNGATQMSLTLTLSRHRDVPLAHGNWRERELEKMGLVSGVFEVAGFLRVAGPGRCRIGSRLRGPTMLRRPSRRLAGRHRFLRIAGLRTRAADRSRRGSRIPG